MEKGPRTPLQGHRTGTVDRVSRSSQRSSPSCDCPAVVAMGDASIDTDTISKKRIPPPLPAEAETRDEASAKRQKTEGATSSVDVAALTKQIEYYFSDGNLSRDRFFHEKVSAHPEGWMDMKYILSCKKIQALKATQEDIINVVSDCSNVETKIDDNNAAWIRRLTPLPPLVIGKKTGGGKKSTKDDKKSSSVPKVASAIHALGYWLKVSGIPEEASWAKVKEALSKALEPSQGKIRQVTPVNADAVAFVYMRPFEGDRAVLEGITSLEINGVNVKVEIINDVETAQKAIESLPPKILRDRERDYAKLKAERLSKPLIVGGTRFESFEHLKKCCRELLDTTPAGTTLNPNAFRVIRAILEYHPRAAEKAKDVVSIKAAVRDDIPNPKTATPPKCFFIVRSDGTSDVKDAHAARYALFLQDFSVLKCFDIMMQDPPIADATAIKTEAADAKTAETTTSSSENGVAAEGEAAPAVTTEA